MNKGIKSFSAHAEYQKVKVELVRHSTEKAMQDELKSRYEDSEDYDLYNKDVIDGAHGLTIGSYEDGDPVIRVYVPCSTPSHSIKLLVSHEAVHACLAILRHGLKGKMSRLIPVRVHKDVSEELLATMIGEMSSLLHHMIDVMESKIREHAFAVEDE